MNTTQQNRDVIYTKGSNEVTSMSLQDNTVNVFINELQPEIWILEW